MPLRSLPLRTAVEYHYRQRLTMARAVSEIGRLVRARRSPLEIAAALTKYQLVAARDADRSVKLMLAEQQMDTSRDGAPIPEMLAGIDSWGRPLSGLTGHLYATDAPLSLWQTVAESEVHAAGSQSGSIAQAVTPSVTAYVRVPNAGACSRCIILAGKVFHVAEAFDRHPHCACTNVPTTRADAKGLTTDPGEIFRGMSTEAQDATFGKAGARAIREGADINQVVNARRGMQPVQPYGRKVKATTEGTTRRGLAHGAGGRAKARLMPESIFEIASNRDDARRLLRLHGYIR